MIEEKRITKPKLQNLVLENRQKLLLTGINDVGSFNEKIMVVDTELGILEVKGSNLHMSKLNLENQELCIEGLVTCLEYKSKESVSKDGNNIFAKLFK